MLLNEAKECEHLKGLSNTINPETGFTTLTHRYLRINRRISLKLYFIIRKSAHHINKLLNVMEVNGRTNGSYKPNCYSYWILNTDPLPQEVFNTLNTIASLVCFILSPSLFLLLINSYPFLRDQLIQLQLLLMQRSSEMHYNRL